jgi:hypothetical protein
MPKPPHRLCSNTGAKKPNTTVSQDMWRDEEIPAFLRTPPRKTKLTKLIEPKDTVTQNS